MAASNATISDFASAKRSAGTFASDRVTTDSSALPIAGRTTRNGGGSSDM